MSSSKTQQLSTFYVGDRLYGIDVMKVQEVTKAMPITEVPLAPKYVHGLINLRGQIATAIGLRQVFNLNVDSSEEKMNVVCQIDGLLMSLIVDRIGDVIDVSEDEYEPAPETVPVEIRKFLGGVFKVPGQILSLIEIGKLSEAIQSQSV